MTQLFDGGNDGNFAGLLGIVRGILCRLVWRCDEGASYCRPQNILERLYEAGVRGIPHRWFSSYLKDRSQQTKLGEVLSHRKRLRHG